MHPKIRTNCERGILNQYALAADTADLELAIQHFRAAELLTKLLEDEHANEKDNDGRRRKNAPRSN